MRYSSECPHGGHGWFAEVQLYSSYSRRIGQLSKEFFMSPECWHQDIKKAWNRRCRPFHSPRLWYAHYCKNRQRQSPRRYEYSSPYPIRIRGRVYTHPRVIYRCYVQDSNREFTRFRRVLNVALVNAFIMSENRYPPFLRRR